MLSPATARADLAILKIGAGCTRNVDWARSAFASQAAFSPTAPIPSWGIAAALLGWGDITHEQAVLTRPHTVTWLRIGHRIAWTRSSSTGHGGQVWHPNLGRRNARPMLAPRFLRLLAMMSLCHMGRIWIIEARAHTAALAVVATYLDLRQCQTGININEHGVTIDRK